MAGILPGSRAKKKKEAKLMENFLDSDSNEDFKLETITGRESTVIVI